MHPALRQYYYYRQVGSDPSVPWWLAGGAIPESTDDTIYDPLAAASLAESYVNLANPGIRDAIVGVAPTHAQGTGWIFNGTTQYLNTQTPFLGTHTLVIWQDNWAAVYSAGSTKILVRPVNSPNTRLTIATNTDLVGPSTNSIIAMRSAQGAYRNGKKLANLGTFTVAGTNENVFIGCRNSGAGVAANFGSGYVLRYAHYKIVLSDAQIEALFNTMRNYNLPSDVAYKNTVLSLNPIAYYTMNQNVGKFFIDETGNLAAAEAYSAAAAPSGVTVGHPGPTGKGLSARGQVANGQIQTQDNDWNTVTGINLDECSWSCWIRNNNSNPQARPCNIYSSTGNEYFAIEIRSGTIAAYSKENGVIWNSANFATATNNTWQHLVGFNSKSQNKIGIYLDGVKYETAKGTTGFLDTTPDPYFPYFLQTMDGYMCHMAFWDHALTQAEVNTLFV